MGRTATLLVAALVVVGGLAAVPATGLAQTATDDSTATATPESDDEERDGNATAPGDLLEGVLGVQEAEVEGEIENRTFGIQVAQAATDDAKADVVADRLDRIEERLTELEERKEELNESRENGTISEAEYRNEIAKLAVETNNTKQLANRSANVSEGLPEEVLREKGINVTAIQTLAERADELTGPEVAEIARSIAGPSVANAAGNATAADNATERRGPPAAAGNATDGNATAGNQGEGAPDDAGGDDASDDAESGSNEAEGRSGGSDGGSGGPP